MPEQELNSLARFGLGCFVAGMLEIGYTVAEIHDLIDEAITSYRTMGHQDD